MFTRAEMIAFTADCPQERPKAPGLAGAHLLCRYRHQPVLAAKEDLTVAFRPAQRTQPAFQGELIALLPRLRRFGLSLTHNAQDADDLVQEACIKAITHADDWDNSQSLDRWVFRILRNHWISELRKRQVRLGQGHVDVTDTEELRVETTAEDELAAQQVMGRLAALPPAYSSVLLLVAVEGYSYKEAAEILDIPQGTVMSRLSRARALLADQLSIQGGA